MVSGSKLGTARGRGATILLLEDEQLAREALGWLLKKMGFEVLMAAGPEEALQLVQAHDPDILLADVVLRGQTSGVEVGRQAQQLLPELAVVLMSGLARELVDGLVDGAERWILIEKPFLVDDLVSALERVLPEH